MIRDPLLNGEGKLGGRCIMASAGLTIELKHSALLVIVVLLLSTIADVSCESIQDLSTKTGAHGDTFSARSKVIELDGENFLNVVKKGVWLVEIYAKWCGHCQQLEPVWNELAHRLSSTEINVAKIDIGKHGNVIKRLGINGIPTIILFRDGRTRIYDSSDRSIDKLQEFSMAKWKDIHPLPIHKDPLTMVGTVYNALIRSPELIPFAYRSLKKNGLNDLVIVCLGMAVPISLGLMFVIFIECFLVPEKKHTD